MMWYDLSAWIGFAFIASSCLAIVLIRIVMAPVVMEELEPAQS